MYLKFLSFFFTSIYPVLFLTSFKPLDVEQQWDYIKAKNSNLVEQLLITERIVTENIHQAKLAAYRGLPVYEGLL